jgi:hypothetical protein
MLSVATAAYSVDRSNLDGAYDGQQHAWGTICRVSGYSNYRAEMLWGNKRE